MGHLQQGSFEVTGDVNEAVTKVWELGGYVRLPNDGSNRIDVVSAAGHYPAIRAALQPTGGAPTEQAQPSSAGEGAEGNEVPPVPQS